jgi:hypothetical protein
VILDVFGAIIGTGMGLAPVWPLKKQGITTPWCRCPACCSSC